MSISSELETGVKLVRDYNSPYLFVREEIVHDIRRRGMRNRVQRGMNLNSSSPKTFEAILNKIK